MSAIREFYGGTYLNTQDVESASPNEKIELKYYKIINSITIRKNTQTQFGVEVVKKCVCNNIITEEKKDIFNCIENEDIADKVLELLKVNKVSPINVVEVLEDLSTKKNRIFIGKMGRSQFSIS